ncbi:uncharacterized protein wu:fc46h12 [Neolamprologus brichardi]|uniref:uncharacterized protein wu:fc46h12 n=1 Tax=Neolamprologus brichardi TaxID=32507 RepID=UPI001643ADC9|nr:uncharacterized protein wu:fc46h12 [Neolamprologus brichardi]
MSSKAKLFGISCSNVSERLVSQIKAWQISRSCLYAGEQCSYVGEAVSEFSTDPADNGTNYCSMQNLMDGSTLSDAEGYKKFSNKWICPGFDAAKCALL